MFAYVGRRILYSVPVMLVASFILFWGVRITFDPGEKFATSKDPTAIIRFRAKWHLNDSIPTQWFTWLKHILRGDFGVSTRTNGDVFPLITRALGTTLQLIIWGTLFSAIISVLIGVYSAVRQYSIPDYTFTALSYIGVAMPPFWFGLVAYQLLGPSLKGWLGLKNPWFYGVGLHKGDSSGIDLDYARHLVLPVMTLTVQSIAEWSRFQRSSMLDVLSSDFVRTAKAKGVPRRKVIFKHALRNALTPLVTIMAVETAALFGGLVITEQIFSIPGMGRLFLTSLQTGDAYTLMAWFLVTAFFVIVFNLVADLFYTVLDPRVRLS